MRRRRRRADDRLVLYELCAYSSKRQIPPEYFFYLCTYYIISSRAQEQVHLLTLLLLLLLLRYVASLSLSRSRYIWSRRPELAEFCWAARGLAGVDLSPIYIFLPSLLWAKGRTTFWSFSDVEYRMSDSERFCFFASQGQGVWEKMTWKEGFFSKWVCVRERALLVIGIKQRGAAAGAEDTYLHWILSDQATEQGSKKGSRSFFPVWFVLLFNFILSPATGQRESLNQVDRMVSFGGRWIDGATEVKI